MTFDAGRNALRIYPIWAELEFDAGQAYIFGVFTKHADGLLAELAAQDTARAAVEAQLLPELHEGAASMDKVARALAMSWQTLYRRRMAMDYLSARKVSVGEAAYLLGFSEASAFVRAFKRWTGASPTHWRAAG